MSVFSDDDLRRLKESLATYKLTGFVSGVTSERLLALLARLEAAERIVEIVRNEHFRHRCDFEKPCELCLALANLGRHRVWHKAKGDKA